jgi:hypothetical protein
MFDLRRPGGGEAVHEGDAAVRKPGIESPSGKVSFCHIAEVGAVCIEVRYGLFPVD